MPEPPRCGGAGAPRTILVPPGLLSLPLGRESNISIHVAEVQVPPNTLPDAGQLPF